MKHTRLKALCIKKCVPVDKLSIFSPIVPDLVYYIRVEEIPHKLLTKSFNFHTMRKIEQQMNRAIVNRNNWSNSNTFVEYNSNTDCSTIVLHRTAIAVWDHNNEAVKLNTGGYTTNTTKSRLNAILDQVMYGARVYQKNFDWFLSYNNQTYDFIDGMILTQGGVV